MDGSRWDAIEKLYERARDLPADERAAFLNAQCRDPAIRSELERLLAGAGEAEALFDELLGTEFDYIGALSGRVRLGPYRLLEPLGSGGMGTVFRAERRVLGVRQDVAIKIVRPGRGDRALRARLLEEARLLTRLQHPGIARFLDGGVTDGGHAYYVMEHVEGLPLDAYCRRHRPDVDERLELFSKICRAVEYAHQQLVVHRDLKPAHILVEDGGRVKLLDFGTARILDSLEAGGTEAGHWITPSYASPEQVRAEPITTHSDQYSLGVILYELLAGCSPYRGSLGSRAELERAVCHETLRPPSEALGPPPGGSGGTKGHEDGGRWGLANEPGRLRKRLSGDLDAIVLKALAFKPTDRYASVAQLADDIGRHRSSRPVVARPPALAYRASRFARRQRTPLLAAGAVLVSLVAGTVVAGRQAAVARQERNRAVTALARSEQVRAFVTNLLVRDDPDGPLLEFSAAEVLERGAAVARDSSLDPAVRAELLDVVGWAYKDIADFASALPLLRDAVALRRRLHPDGHPDLAESLSHLGRVLGRVDRYEESESLLREALAMEETLLGPGHPRIAETLVRLALTVYRRDRPYESLELLRRALAVRREALGPDHPLVMSDLRAVASALARVGEDGESERLHREVLRTEERVFGPGHPRVGNAALALAEFLDERGRVEEAGGLYARALAIHEQAYEGDDPRLPWALAARGRFLVEHGRPEQGLALLRRAVEIERRAWGADHLKTASTLGILAEALQAAGRWAEAERVYLEVIDIESRALREAGTAGRWIEIASGRIARGDLDGAEAAMLEGLAIRRRGGGPGLPTALGRAARLYRLKGDFRTADALLREGLAAAERLPHGGSFRMRLLAESLRLYEEWGRPAEAERVRELLAAGQPPRSPGRAPARER